MFRLTSSLCCGESCNTENRPLCSRPLCSTYDADDGSLATFTAATGETVSYNYDELKRQKGISVANGNTVLYQTARSFTPGSGSNQTTPLTHFYNYKTESGSVITGWLYGYDTAGNISQIRESLSPYRVLVSYIYDEQNQLTKETWYTYSGTSTTPSSTKVYTYTYDTAGNLLTSSDGTNTSTYTYGDSDWVDLLTQVKVGNTTRTISYSGGNPTNWYNGTTYTNLTWTQGRQLAGLTNNGTATTYAYDMEGVRASKTVGSVTHEYITQSGKVVQESYNNIILQFFYDASGRPFALKYSNDSGSTWTTMYYVLNLQGDVVALIGGFSGSNYNTYATYQYDAWGRVLSATSTYTNVPKYAHIAEINPLRYRGYYYDTETGWYYLQSRYYDPILKRFLNADGYASTGQGFLGYNMFAYCLNTPVKYADVSGKDAVVLLDENSFSHIGLLIQDSDGKWYHFYWGAGDRSSSGDIATLFGNSCIAYTYCEPIELDNPNDIGEINRNSSYHGYDKMEYFTGNYSDCLEYAQTASNHYGLYNLYSNNCSQVSFKILCEAKDGKYAYLFSLAEKDVIPKHAFNIIAKGGWFRTIFDVFVNYKPVQGPNRPELK